MSDDHRVNQQQALKVIPALLLHQVNRLKRSVELTAPCGFKNLIIHYLENHAQRPLNIGLLCLFAP